MMRNSAKSKIKDQSRLNACISSLSLASILAKSIVNPFFCFLDDMGFSALLGFERVLRTGYENVTKGYVLVELDMRSYVPEARLRVKVSFYKNQMVAVTCGHDYPFVIASRLE